MLLSDIGLPEMDGYELLRHLREHEATTKLDPVPAIAVTAFAREEDRNQALEAGFQHYLSKPIEPDELLAVVTNAVRPTRHR